MKTRSILLIALVTWSLPVHAGPDLTRRFDYDLELVNLFVWKNDGDFDRSKPLYDAHGQTEGFLATFLHPFLHARVGEVLHFFYETEIGMDLWSERNPDHWLGLEGSRALSMKQREIWGELTYEGWIVKAGFQRMVDVSGLFVNHWIGAARVGYGDRDGSHVLLSVGQLPDQTHEGWTWGETFGNFNTDVLLGCLDGAWRWSDVLALHGGAYFLHDASRVGMPRDLGAAALRLAAGGGPAWAASLSFITQFGRTRGAAGDRGDQEIFTWAAEASGRWTRGMVTLRGALLAMSADDVDDTNDALGFIWSGKRAAQSVLLSENELRDIGDNVDERIAVYDGFFWEARTGMLSADLGLWLDPLPWLTAGLASEVLLTLNPDTALGGRLIGWETALHLDAHILEGMFQVHAVGGVLLPGKAGAALVNGIDNEATAPVGFTQVALIMRF